MQPVDLKYYEACLVTFGTSQVFSYPMSEKKSGKTIFTQTELKPSKNVPPAQSVPLPSSFSFVRVNTAWCDVKK